MNISKSDCIAILKKIQRGETIPQSEHNSFILFDLVRDGMISISEEPVYVGITYFGLQELASWDQVLEVSVNTQLLQEPHGEA